MLHGRYTDESIRSRYEYPNLFTPLVYVSIGIARLEERFAGIADAVEMVDVATPVTWERYTGNWRGAYEGWMMDEDSFTSSMKKSLPGLDRFYMAGQWVNPGGGIPTAIMSGNHTIQLICKQDGRRFVSG